MTPSRVPAPSPAATGLAGAALAPAMRNAPPPGARSPRRPARSRPARSRQGALRRSEAATLEWRDVKTAPNARGASTTEAMLSGGWKTARMVAHYAAGAKAERNAVAKYLQGAPL